ncbi:MAG: FAD-dependent monooxygenase [Chitinophagales bacterium]|nr:FAD-dependent monooxygenase [Chitinophagales bacterium]
MQQQIAISGAGLVGSLLACYLAKRQYKVSVYERRSDSRKSGYAGGRSINLALSNRGWAALENIGLKKEIESIALPMSGRIIHHLSGEKVFQPYGKEGQAIYSVSRGILNETLMDAAEKAGVSFHFNQHCIDVNFENTEAIFENTQSKAITKILPEVLLAAEGAYSEVRYKMQRTHNFNISQQHESHGYKELVIPALNGNHQIEKNALHIWPRESFMMIALPNLDGSFTCTLFAPLNGENGFNQLKTTSDVTHYFNRHFPDAVPLMPTLLQDFFENPTGSLVTVKCFPWNLNNTCLIGDAAHAVVPFYGQGMNCGFEDVRILDELLTKHNQHWETVLNEFQYSRKPNADAIADLALYNFIEMRDLSGRADFQLRLKIEKRIAEAFPDKFQTLYSMVTFNQTPYSEAQERGKKQSKLLDEIMQLNDIENVWQSDIILQKAQAWLSNN